MSHVRNAYNWWVDAHMHITHFHINHAYHDVSAFPHLMPRYIIWKCNSLFAGFTYLRHVAFFMFALCNDASISHYLPSEFRNRLQVFAYWWIKSGRCQSHRSLYYNKRRNHALHECAYRPSTMYMKASLREYVLLEIWSEFISTQSSTYPH